jgi:hypothetical protein
MVSNSALLLRQFTVSVQLTVSAEIVSAAWLTTGSLDDRNLRTCESRIADAPTYHFSRVDTSPVAFYGCDVDGLPVVSRAEDSAFTAVLLPTLETARLYETNASELSRTLAVSFIGEGAYAAGAAESFLGFTRIGLFEIKLMLHGVETGAFRMPVSLQCDPRFVPLEDGISCGCEAGTYLPEGGIICQACVVGTFSARGASSCSACGLFDKITTTSTTDDQFAPNGISCHGMQLNGECRYSSRAQDACPCVRL